MTSPGFVTARSARSSASVAPIVVTKSSSSRNAPHATARRASWRRSCTLPRSSSYAPPGPPPSRATAASAAFSLRSGSSSAATYAVPSGTSPRSWIIARMRSSAPAAIDDARGRRRATRHARHGRIGRAARAHEVARLGTRLGDAASLEQEIRGEHGRDADAALLAETAHARQPIAGAQRAARRPSRRARRRCARRGTRRRRRARRRPRSRLRIAWRIPGVYGSVRPHDQHRFALRMRGTDRFCTGHDTLSCDSVPVGLEASSSMTHERIVPRCRFPCLPDSRPVSTHASSWRSRRSTSSGARPTSRCAWRSSGLPPFGMAGTRFVLAGGALLAIASAARRDDAVARAWLVAVPVGALLFLCGNGLVVVAEQTLPSSVAAVVCATTPLIASGHDGVSRRATARASRSSAWCSGSPAWCCSGSARRSPSPGGARCSSSLAPIGWALGSLVARSEAAKASGASRGLGAAGAQMMTGGVWMLLTSVVLGEHMPATIAWESVARVGVPRRLRLARRLHGVQLAARALAARGRDELRLREPGHRRAARRGARRRASRMGDARRDGAHRRRRHGRPCVVGRKSARAR